MPIPREPESPFPVPFPPSGSGGISGIPPQPDCQAYKATWVDLTGLRCPHCGGHIGMGRD